VALSINDEKTLRREFENLVCIEDNYPKYVITMDKFEGQSYKGINCLDLDSFLMSDKF
jgi:predicted AAA+ superfamily ATPase